MSGPRTRTKNYEIVYVSEMSRGFGRRVVSSYSSFSCIEPEILGIMTE
jgi:hypothetical protein